MPRTAVRRFDCRKATPENDSQVDFAKDESQIADSPPVS
jgi:hypothetical protein